MRLIVIVPTVRRRDVVAATVERLQRQTRQPDAIIVSTTERDFVPAAWLESNPSSGSSGQIPIVCLIGKVGCCSQRNVALDVVLGKTTMPGLPPALQRPLEKNDVITFFDDDFLPADDYLETLEREFNAHQDWVVLSGSVPYDGAHNQGYSFDEGVRLLNSIDRSGPQIVTEHVGAYGCNMSFRAGAVRDRRFDERLPLYGWQEDIDFTSRLHDSGKIISISSLVGVHLGVKSGRVNGLRFGYSQIANPIYLIRKGTMPATFGIELMVRNFAANTLRSAWPEAHIDRRGRLVGNLLGLMHAVTGRVQPENILKL